MNIETEFIIKQAVVNGNVQYSLQYHDYTPDEWTVPALLTIDRANQLLTDNSIKTIKLIHDNEVKYIIP